MNSNDFLLRGTLLVAWSTASSRDGGVLGTQEMWYFEGGNFSDVGIKYFT